METLDENEFLNKLIEYQEEYTNGEPTITDEEFDFLVDMYEKKFRKKFNKVGHIPRDSAVLLPWTMPSLEKFKGDNAEKQINRWIQKYPGKVLIMDKLDGVSLLYMPKIRKLYTRGNGIYGQDVSHLLTDLNLPINDYSDFESLTIRGELIFTRKTFKKYSKENKEESKNKLKKARNLVNGLVTGKNLDLDLLRKAKFYAFKIVEKNGEQMKPSSQFRLLSELNFEIPWIRKHETSNDLLRNLNFFLESRTGRIDNEDIPKAKYDIDGLVVIHNQIYPPSTDDKPPKYSFAFKIDTLVETTIINMKWRCSSKDGYLTPVAYVETVEILGSDVSKVSCHNAKFVFDKHIGIGAKILLTLGGDIIPKIVDVLEESENYVYPNLSDDEYMWDINNVEFVLTNPESNDNVRKSRIKYFMVHMGIKNFGEKSIDTLFENGFDTLKKLFNMKPRNIKNLSRFGETLAEKMCKNLKDGITNVPLYKVMTASCIFGEGFAESRFKSILKEYPNINELASLKRKKIVEKILSINGFGEITAKQFALNLPKFIDWLNIHNEIIVKAGSSSKKTKIPYKIILFSGFRDQFLKAQLEEMGIEIKNSISNKVELLIVKGVSDMNNQKAQIAILKGIEIITLEEFRARFF